MIIDFHTHAFPDRIAASAVASLAGRSHTVPFTDGTNASLAASMKDAGIDLSVILPVATAPRQVEHINDNAAQISRSAEETGLLSFAGIHPCFPDWEAELERAAALGLKGIKIHPVYQDIPLDDPRFIRIFRKCGELGLIVVTHTGFDIGLPGVGRSTPLMARHAIEEAGPFTFVLAHMGGWKEWDDALRLLAGTGVYLDTAFSTDRITPSAEGYFAPEELKMLGPSEFIDMVHAFGSDHILFGTDSPWSPQKESLAWIRQLALPREDIDRILGGNAKALLGL